MPTGAASADGCAATTDTWNRTGTLLQVEVAQFCVDEASELKNLGHVVGLSSLQTGQSAASCWPAAEPSALALDTSQFGIIWSDDGGSGQVAVGMHGPDHTQGGLS